MRDDDELYKRRLEEDLLRLYQEKFSIAKLQTGILQQRFVRTASKEARVLRCNK